jgi:hypothetical protein
LDEPSEYIDFMAKYKDWVAIKRMGIRSGTKPEEAVYHLAGIRSTIDTRMYRLLGIDTTVLDKASASITSGMRKSYDSLGEAVKRMGSAEAKSALSASCNGRKELEQIAATYLLGKVITDLKFDSCVNQLILSKVFPELKPPKAPGRMGKATPK